MGRFGALVFTATAIFLYFPLISHCQTTQTFIVRVQNDLKPSVFSSVEDWYSATLRTLTSYPLNSLESTNIKRGKQTDFLHVYKTVFHGFSARLTAAQARELSKRPEVLGVLPDRVLQIQTTRTPSFLGLTGNNPTGLITKSDSGSNLIIGLLDTGITPDRRSFHDVGLGPVPTRWKGECIGGEKFTNTSCNKKIIGARYFSAGYEASVGTRNSTDVLSPRDSNGHGTHTASTAAGREVTNASLFGLATGVAVGIAPKARIAVYKICWKNGCLDSDILAGFDKAVEDGVDIISLSVGSDGGSIPYNFDPIAIGSFGAMERGVFVSASAGNSGPAEMLVANVAPWITTVGASTIDRKFPVDLILANGTVITGSSSYNGKPLDGKTYYPLIYAADAVKHNSSESFPFPSLCMPGSLDEKLVRGKIVVCDRGEVSRVAKGIAVREAGGVGVVVAGVPPDGEGLMAEPHVIPGLLVTESGGNKVRDYISASKKPMATIVSHGTRLGVKPAPVVASFSSRGPNAESSYVLKPDMIAPGVDILAAWPDTVSPSQLAEDTRRSEFNILSGTSMSCPHVSGLAALLKAAHPDWSPAMIKSALMTTAYTVDNSGKPLLDEKDYSVLSVWGTGAGHVDPEKAADPGLVYDLTVSDYLDFLCSSNYSVGDIERLTHIRPVSCNGTKSTPWELNYPAISVAVDMSPQLAKFEVAATRTATHVSDGGASSYTVTVVPPRGVKVIVDPPKMEFIKKGEKKSYVVRISGANEPPGKVSTESGKLTWTDGKHEVTSPIVVVWQASNWDADIHAGTR